MRNKTGRRVALLRRGLALVVASMVATAACASSTTTESTGIADTDTGDGSAIAETAADSGGSADEAGGSADSNATEGGSNAVATPAVDDGRSDAKQAAAKTISELSDADPAPNGDIADVAELVFGEPNDGAIEEPFGVDRWTFEGEAGALIAIDVLAIDHDCRQDLTMVLESPSGERGEVGWVGNGGCQAHGPFELEEPGVHVIELQGGDGSVIEETTGAYRMVPLALTERDVAPVVFDQPLDGEIVELFGVDRWTFEATEGDLIVIDVLAIDHDCRQDITMTLEDPFQEREELSWVGNGGCQANEPIEIGRTGPHVLEFHGGSGSVIEEATGTYRYVLSLLTEFDEETAVPDTRLDGEITQPFGADRWTFEASEGQRVIIEVHTIDHDCRQDLTLTLEDPFGDRTEIAWVGNGGCELYEPIELDQSGTYVIEFAGGSGSVIEENLGGYSFSFSLT